MLASELGDGVDCPSPATTTSRFCWDVGGAEGSKEAMWASFTDVPAAEVMRFNSLRLASLSLAKHAVAASAMLARVRATRAGVEIVGRREIRIVGRLGKGRDLLN